MRIRFGLLVAVMLSSALILLMSSGKFPTPATEGYIPVPKVNINYNQNQEELQDRVDEQRLALELLNRMNQEEKMKEQIKLQATAPPPTKPPLPTVPMGTPTRTRKVSLIDAPHSEQFWTWYKPLHDGMTAGVNQVPRYAVFQKHSAWGWGNHMVGLWSTMLFAILTDRAILVDDPHFVGQAIDWPITWQYDQVKGSLQDLTSKEYSLQNDDCFIDGQGLDEDLTTGDFDIMYPEQVVFWASNCPAFHWIARNPKYEEKMKKFGLIPESGVPRTEYGFHAVASIARLFFSKVRPDLQSRLDKILEEWRSNNGFVLGLQVRSAFIREELPVYWDCVTNVTDGRTNVKLFIASDNHGVLEEGRLRFKENFLDVHDLFHDEMEHIIADNYLLGECDEIIMTPRSTFGATAVVRAGKLPMYVSIDGKCMAATAERGPVGRWQSDKSVLW